MPVKLPMFLIIAVTLLLTRPSPAHAPASDVDRESKIKAGVVLNFVRYTEWPQSNFADDDTPITIAVLGEGTIAEHLEQVMKDQEAHGRPIEVHRLEYPRPETDAAEKLRILYARLKDSHVVFICLSERERLRSILGQLEGLSILTVSDIASFAEQGGMLGLSIRQDRVVFDANQQRIRAAELKVSSQLLRLARIVD